MFDFTSVSTAVLKDIEVFPKGMRYKSFSIEILQEDCFSGEGSYISFSVKYKGEHVKSFEDLSEAFQFVFGDN